MRPAFGIAVVLAASALAVVSGGPLRERLPAGGIDALTALAGAGMGAGGLMTLDDVGTASWIAAPVLIAVIAPLHVRALFARGGPLRT
jgi:hypothetical protein